MRIVRLLPFAVLLTAATLAGSCSDGGSSVPDSYGGGEAWDGDYNTTTCSQWRTEMTDGQQLTVASDMLIGMRERNGGGSGLPDEVLVSDLRDAICSGAGDGDGVRETAVIAYFADQEHFNG